MQIRCTFCHKPFAMSKDAVLAALDTMEADGLTHYNAQCPHCRRINRVSLAELQRAIPNRERQAQEGKDHDNHTEL